MSMDRLPANQASATNDSAQFQCPVCKGKLLAAADGQLLCSNCEGNTISIRCDALDEAEREYALDLCEEVIWELIEETGNAGFAGLARVHLHWLMVRRPRIFARNGSHGVSPGVVKCYLHRHLRENLTSNGICCTQCNAMMIDSKAESPLECPSCGGKEVEVRSFILGQIASLTARGISLK